VGSGDGTLGGEELLGSRLHSTAELVGLASESVLGVVVVMLCA
jgi:hypothetical protein